MRGFGLRRGVKIVIVTLGLTVVAILLAVLEDKCETYDPWSFFLDSLPWSEKSPFDDVVNPVQHQGIIVVPTLHPDEVSWIADELPEWQSAIYYFDSPSNNSNNHSEPDLERLTTPANKGNEAMTYLTYIIEHYHQPIPEVVVFVHSHRDGFFRAWHVDTALHSNVDSIRHLRVDHVLKTGYVNLRCNRNPGCMKLEKRNSHVTGQVWKEIFANTSTPAFSSDPEGPAAVSSFHESRYEYPSMDAADSLESDFIDIKSPCCAQFAVSAKQIYQRPLNDYLNIRQWLLDTTLDNAHSGRVMEFLWHVIFGREAVQ
ncbi:hypothetical protein LTR84_002689 [Exophiala bonariae]|uniref:Uncharacterized protein n=1 Tax=Exophiala bonariae TaxID=1690606 RepID=A0AAV9N9D9_9EURO|nr:hypothetical protein LTR84_002689 [Exophiala bonariae]